MQALLDGLSNTSPLLIACIVFALVFAEDAIFVGFVIPGETAAVVGGVIASRGIFPLWGMLLIVVAAAITGDTVGYEIGKHFGPRVIALKILDKRREQLQKAEDFLKDKGGLAVFLGRFTAFFRAVMPALAGLSQMPYKRFAFWNFSGGIIWGSLFVTLGFVAGNSYEQVARTVGRGAAAVVAVVAIAIVIVWQVRKHRAKKA
ncbi:MULTISPECIES: DedA family protein [Arthrobacter]|uniref:DedA family protein n=1 Tax=Arthrobacter terricola TaxID=2547396 RepID=A0A4R5KUB3_9MICC|nr:MULTISPECIES: DedA family protein [Arthrobacter]MBT8160455.1 DedA family protein [Arthrobacter sp. GN70]TDF98500.1 DedA family protein [Arthrobacter terricola]